MPKITDHFLQRADLVKELRSLGEQYAAEQIAHSRGPLFLGPWKFSGVEWRGVGNRAVMFGVPTEGLQKRCHAGESQAANPGVMHTA